MFLLDEHQVVKPNEIGTVEAIKSHAAAMGSPGPPCLRWTGSSAAVAAASTRTGCSGCSTSSRGGPEAWTGDDHFEVRLAESPWELENILRDKIKDGLLRADVGRVLLALERPASGRHAR